MHLCWFQLGLSFVLQNINLSDGQTLRRLVEVELKYHGLTS
jgi:hypothetical protein